jgi:hypothetical protein
MIRRAFFVRFLAMCVVWLCGMTAQAAIISYDFTGSLYNTNDPGGILSSRNIQTGTKFKGRFTYNTSARSIPPVGNDPFPDSIYYDTKLNVNFNIAGINISSNTKTADNYGYVYTDPYNGGRTTQFRMSTGISASSPALQLKSDAFSQIYFTDYNLDVTRKIFHPTRVPQTLSLTGLRQANLNFWGHNGSSPNSASDFSALGHLESLSRTMPVLPPVAPIAPRPPRLLGDNTDFDPSKPTVVITHGWQPYNSITGQSTPDWVSPMATQIRDLVPNFRDVNVLEVYWPDATTPQVSAADLRNATASVASVGKQLAKALSDLPGDFSAGIQFIGHSLGSLVNAYAANVLTSANETITQFTILDRPFGVGIRPNNVAFYVGGDADQQIFRTLLPKGKVVWLDNYYGNDYIDVTPSTGASFQGKALAYNRLYKDVDHTEVHQRYAKTVSLDSNCTSADGGFGCSMLFSNFNNRPASQNWDPLQSLQRPAGDILSINTNDWLTFNCEINDQVSNAKCSEGSPAYLWLENYSFASDAEYLAFDLNWLNIGDGDWLTVHFKDVLLFTFSGEAFFDADFINSGLIPIFDLAGQSGQFLFSLNSVGNSNAVFEIRNIEIFRTGAFGVAEPSTFILLGICFLFVGRSRQIERVSSKS